MPTIRYILHPAQFSRRDGRIYTVSARTLAGRYGVSLDECYINDALSSRFIERIPPAEREQLIDLLVRTDGCYRVPICRICGAKTLDNTIQLCEAHAFDETPRPA